VWPPAPPANVIAYSPSTAQVNVSWQAPSATFGSPVTGYALQRATDSGFTQNVTTVYSGTSTSYNDTGAAPGATYYYRVTAASANGTSDASRASQATALTPGSSTLINISSRAFVGTGGNVLIDGFVISGSAPQTVLIRASGPALALAPFSISGVLVDPDLKIYSGSSVIAENIGWGGNALISTTAASVGAFGWTDSTSADAALLMTLNPGPYTAIVSGASGDTGVSLLEVYASP
jgi:hypothetical protein